MTEKYGFIDAECTTVLVEGEAPTIGQMCAWLGVSTSGFYDWRKRPQSDAAQRRELLKIKIKALFEANNEEYGYRRLHAPGPRRRVRRRRDRPQTRARAGPGTLPAEALAAVADRAGRGRADSGSGQP